MRWMLMLPVLLGQLAPMTVPPPPRQVAADCGAPSYASDVLVCGDAELFELDRLLASLIAQRPAPGPNASPGPDEEWFRQSRLCAFEVEHNGCLLAAYCARIALLAPATNVEAPTACDLSGGDETTVSALSASGFARSRRDVLALSGQQIRLSGFVDHHNLYGDAGAKAILGDWWSGDGPAPTTWRFNLKAHAGDEAGQSFAVHVPNDRSRDDLLRVFVADARSRRPTRVVVRGTLSTFDAPTNGAVLTGLRLELPSSRDIRIR